MSLLEDIVRRGNRPPLGRPHRKTEPGLPRDSWITCADGFELSVVAGPGTYCKPRPDLLDDAGPFPKPFGMADVPTTYPGPYTHAEVGYPSERPEPWDLWSEYAEEPDEASATVYAYVPADMVRALVASHGGEK